MWLNYRNRHLAHTYFFFSKAITRIDRVENKFLFSRILSSRWQSLDFARTATAISTMRVEVSVDDNQVAGDQFKMLAHEMQSM